MTVWKTPIGSKHFFYYLKNETHFKSDWGPLSYVVQSEIQVPSFVMRPQSEQPSLTSSISATVNSVSSLLNHSQPKLAGIVGGDANK